MLKIKIEISKENISKNTVGFDEDCQRWAFDDDATIETLYSRIVSEKYLPRKMTFADGWTLYINNEAIFFIDKFSNEVEYFCNKHSQLSSLVVNNSLIYSKFVIKTNEIYNIIKLISDIKIAIQKWKLEKMKESYSKKFKKAKIESIYNKIIELCYTNETCKNLSEVFYVFSDLLDNRAETNVREYIDKMLDELYCVVLDENEFDKLIQEKYSWLSKENKKLVKTNLWLGAR